MSAASPEGQRPRPQRRLGPVVHWFFNQPLIVQIIGGLILFVILGGPAVVVIQKVGEKGGPSSPSSDGGTTVPLGSATFLADQTPKSGSPETSQTALVSGKAYLKSVQLRSQGPTTPTEVDYDLRGGFSELDVKVGVADGTPFTDVHLSFQFYAAGSTTALAEKTVSVGPPVELKVPLKGVSTVQLIVSSPNNPCQACWTAVFGEAQVR